MGSTKTKDEVKEGKKKPVEEGAEKKVEKKPEKKAEKRPDKAVQLREIVRVATTDLDGSKPIGLAITKIKGISYAMSKAICNSAGIDPRKNLGSFTPDELSKIEKIIKSPKDFGIPIWLCNRRNDLKTGEDMHLSGADLIVAHKFDIQGQIDIKSHKGIRHMLGLPVRGQRTRSNFRKGRSMGVVRKAAVKIGPPEKETKK
jgi:small subunit ribosomal protein S13